MSVTISADDPRTIRAIEIAAEADQWLVYRDASGNQAFRVPSQSAPNRAYLVTPSSCECPDFNRRSLDDPATGADEHACKHILAVRLHRELVRAQLHESHSTAQRRRGHLHLVP